MHQEITQPSRTGRNCQCGGIVRKHQLTGDREAWTCGGCGRYQAISRSTHSAESGADQLALRGRESLIPR